MFILPKLDFDYKDLEPYIDSETMLIHHTRHHQSYVDNLNKTLAGFPDLQKLTLDEILTKAPEFADSIKQAVINNAGGHANHSFFWKILRPPLNESSAGLEPSGKIADIINTEFNSFDNFKEQFTTKAMSVFGSGWCFWVLNKDKKLIFKRQSFQNAPQMEGNIPILGIDLWEHAYYLKYQNRKLDYINAWWKIVNWDQVNLNFELSMK